MYTTVIKILYFLCELDQFFNLRYNKILIKLMKYTPRGNNMH